MKSDWLYKHIAILGLILSALMLTTPYARAETALIATATNFRDTLEMLKKDFEATNGHQLTITTGSTGKLYTQISYGAPFDIFLAADQDRPKYLEENGYAVPGSRFTYATGLLTLWSKDTELLKNNGEAYLQQSTYRRLAIANPDLAPYGEGALEILRALDLNTHRNPKLVMGENAGQAFALVASGNAEAGLLPLSLVASPNNNFPGSRWDPPLTLYNPIHQDAVLLVHGKENTAAIAFLDYLKSQQAKAIIKRFGYRTEATLD